MIVPGSTNPLLMRSAAPAAYQISRSLRFNSADSAALSRTFSTAGNRRTWTLSWWMKLGKLGTARGLFGMPGTSSGAPQFWSIIDNDDQIYIYDYVSSSTYQFVKKSAVKLRDASAWYHCMFVYDSTQSVAEDGFKIYLNGTRLTTWTTNTLTGYVQNYQGAWNSTQNTGVHIIGQSDNYFDGYMADIWFVGGSALTPSDFAETNATTGQWVPKAYTGSTSGTNTFHLEFADNSGTTSTTLGKDTSGNSNNFTPSGFSVTAGSGNDSLTDTPTSYGTDTGTGAEVRGNYATLNPLAQSSGTFSNGNLEYIGPNNFKAAPSTILLPSTGKFYVEATLKAAPNGTTFGGTWAMIGVIAPSAVAAFSYNTGTSFFVTDTGQYSNYNTDTSGTIGTFASGTVVGLAINRDTNQVTVYQDGTSKATVTLGITSGADLYVFSGSYGSSYGQMACNFGQRAFAYTAPSGFKALVDTNLTAPTIAKPSTVFDVVTYTGTGSALTPTSSLGFSPDLIWIKSRSAATDNTLYDTVRGAEKRLESNTTDAEVTSDGGVTAFNSNGFTLGTLAQVNTNAATYVGWCWDGGTSTATNTQGSITSSVRANVSAGFSIVTYTGNATAGATVGHGLGVQPEFIIGKNRGGTDAWWVWSKAVSSGATAFLRLNATNAILAETTIANDTAPTSTLITLGSDLGWNSNQSPGMVLYCFAPVIGYSSMGSYIGNGSSDGPFIYTGFRPAFVMIKCSNSGQAGNAFWAIYDKQRLGYNPDNAYLRAQATSVENTNALIDLTSNGFKLRNSNTSQNASNDTYVYIAFAENPFQHARAR
jgi:hypothetical protein